MKNIKDLAVWITNAVTRKKYPFTAVSIEQDANGSPTSITGTITTTVNDSDTIIPMVWLINGQAMSNDRGFDLVKSQTLDSILAS